MNECIWYVRFQNETFGEMALCYMLKDVETTWIDVDFVQLYCWQLEDHRFEPKPNLIHVQLC